MKLNSLEFAKTLSDFLFLEIDNPEEKARKLFTLKHSLSPHWFEKYIEYYFNKQKKWYTVKLNWKTYECDSWIDLKWVKYENFKNTIVVIQCKKYWIKDISEDQIAHFYGKVIDKVINAWYEYELYYITTSKFTQKAIDFWKEKNIKMINFYDIYNLWEYYALESFKKDLIKEEWYEEYNKCFTDSQKMLELYDNYFNITTPTNTELYHFLKQVRRDYSNKIHIGAWYIAKNDTLKLLSEKRPHNLDELKKIIKDLPTREKNKLNKHWYVFIQRLELMHFEENTKIQKSIFSNILEFFK